MRIEDMLLDLNAKGYRVSLKNHVMLNPVMQKRERYPEEPLHVEGFVLTAYAPMPIESIHGGVGLDPVAAVKYVWDRANERTEPLTQRPKDD